MRKILFAFFILFTSCIVKDGPFSPSLTIVLDEIINEHPTYDVIQIQASKLEGHELFFITCLSNYNSKMIEGYYIYKNKLITYYQTDSTDRSKIIDIRYLQKFKGDIVGYKNFNMSNDISEPIQNLYEIIDECKFTLINKPESLVLRKNKIEGENVIKNKKINIFLNAYINSNINVLYELRFKVQNSKHYALIRSMIYYDKDKYNGYFYRDGNLIIIYGIDSSEKILDRKLIKKDKQGIPNFKYGTIDDWNYPYPVKLEILPNGNIRKLSLSEGFAI